jgi:tRNA dimethylallyltransferase
MASKSVGSPPLVVIVGPTASGKTALAIKLAKEFHGEIICADSRTIYKGADVGTAKPTDKERRQVPHWGLDIVEPGERFTAYDFKQYADLKIDEIRQKGNVPFLVGGTGLYVDAVIFDYQFGESVDASVRHQLESMSIDELYNYCSINNITLPENHKNKRYIVRAIERKNISAKRRDAPIVNTIVVGISTSRDVLRKRIKARSEQIFDDDVVNEATRLGEKYGWENEAMTGNIYPLVRKYLKGKTTLEAAKTEFRNLDWQLAKRQLTWLRRNPHIVWRELDEAYYYIKEHLVVRR